MDILNEAMQIANDKTLVRDYVNSNKFSQLDKKRAQDMSILLENTQNDIRRSLNENTYSADIAQFTPILMPMVRRVFPNLIANELLGVQPMSMPTGFIYALTNQYLGTSLDHVDGGTSPSGVIYELEGESTLQLGDPVSDGAVVYTEYDARNGTTKILCSFKDSNQKLPVGDTSLGNKIVGIYTNESSFLRILKNYTGPVSTAEAELLGESMKQIGFSIDCKSVEATSRALKGVYSVEMYQDLKAQHQLSADEELMSLMQYEIQAELDREIVDFVNANATQLPDTNFSLPANASDIIIPDGRWEIERYRSNVIRIAKEAAIIGIDTKRGQGNTLLVSPLVATMLEQVGSFQLAPVGSSINSPVSGGVAGVFDNRYKVVVDQYATSDYCTVLYKGDDRRDAMGFYCPYVPLQFTRVTDATTGQPAIIAKTRYALTTIPGVEHAKSGDRASTYARSFGVDFSNTILSRK
jgi:hypothetical protein